MGGSEIDGTYHDRTGGAPYATPVCAINCTNMMNGDAGYDVGKGWYSFHPGGVHILLADGTVRFLNENTSNFVVMGLITGAKGETFSF